MREAGGSEARFREGVRLFNQRTFFEAHEIWEEDWKAAGGDKRLFYQGMIQSAAALVHISRGNYPGAISLYHKSHQKLAHLPEVWMGIDLAQFRSDLARYFAAVLGAFGTNGDRQPTRDKQILEAKQLPTIRWAP
jgi:uncharacterized protein